MYVIVLHLSNIIIPFSTLTRRIVYLEDMQKACMLNVNRMRRNIAHY